MILEQIGKAPRALRLEHQDIMAAVDELTQDSAQKMRVTVIPA
jgi:hypothetical protein